MAKPVTRIAYAAGALYAASAACQPAAGAEVAAGRAQIAGGGEGRVVDVVRIRDLSVGRGTPPGPRRRDELHRPDRVVPPRITVEQPALRRGRDGDVATGAVEGRTQNRDARESVHRQHAAFSGAVAGLDRSDAGQHRPVDVAPGLLRRDHELSVGVRADRRAWDPGPCGDRCHPGVRGADGVLGRSGCVGGGRGGLWFRRHGRGHDRRREHLTGVGALACQQDVERDHGETRDAGGDDPATTPSRRSRRGRGRDRSLRFDRLHAATVCGEILLSPCRHGRSGQRPSGGQRPFTSPLLRAGARPCPRDAKTRRRHETATAPRDRDADDGRAGPRCRDRRPGRRSGLADERDGDGCRPRGRAGRQGREGDLAGAVTGQHQRGRNQRRDGPIVEHHRRVSR